MLFRKLILIGLLPLALTPLAQALGSVDPITLANTTEKSLSSKPKAAPVIPAVEKSYADSARLIEESQLPTTSNVFGGNLFQGNFAKNGAGQFSPDYVINSGDHIQLVMWGGVEIATELVVDPQGNLFLPNVGPIPVRGVRNQDLQKIIDQAIKKVYRANVFNYASLAAAQPVRVFVGGNVKKPGMYSGTSMDSLLYYLDQAGGIDTERGSFLAVQIKRGNEIRATVNLYDFLLKGKLQLTQLSEGDVIFIPQRQNTITVSGLASNNKTFEFSQPQISVAALAALAAPQVAATHVRITRHSGEKKNIDYYSLAQAAEVQLNNGDAIEYTADKKPGSITVRVEGEHLSAQEYVLPYGAKVGDLLEQIQYTPNAAANSPQLFRNSIKEQQKEMLAVALKSLEASVLTARSGTSDEARLRSEEAQLILQWIDRAKSIQPSGQVIIANSAQRNNLLLENGDLIRIPIKDGLVLISGEVLFPNAIAFDQSMKLDDYIQSAGGYTQNADNSRVIIAHQDGRFTDSRVKDHVAQGDKVLVLPKIDVKTRQIVKDMTQIVYQIAVAAAVVLGL
ncbi:polysaccharide biosynthesis/export family protein [uncultured Deefgea sp.]|uniref:polysaccharide biosynthesis/export family protein n=1 Tax=uncultured Deefgea sp. TaxID=1304914 RepID=UPI0025993778|nr:polysaccharide biosynthesis/export family protein [uncultured Deefgea sp.]